MKHIRPNRSLPLALVGLALLGAGCEAQFTDLRPNAAPLAGSSVDAGFIDVGVVPPSDGGGTVPSRTTVAVANWSGVGSYSAAGSATVFVENGTAFVELSEDFTVSRVPGPVLVLTTRDAIGSRIDPGAGDVELGPVNNSAAGQRFAVPADAINHDVIWIFCKPFGVEIARGELER